MKLVTNLVEVHYEVKKADFVIGDLLDVDSTNTKKFLFVLDSQEDIEELLSFRGEIKSLRKKLWDDAIDDIDW